MAFWGGAKLLDEVKKRGIVRPFDENKIDCSAYTLTLGAEAFVTPSFGDDLRGNLKKPLDLPEEETLDGSKKLKGGGTVVIPPGQFAFLLTEEIVSIPKNAMGFISLKSKEKFKGLINVSGFHVDPGFKGRLIYSVFNAGPAALHLSRGDNLFLLWLADLAGSAKKPYYKEKPGYVEIPSELVSDVSRETHSLQDLSNRVDAISETFRTIKSVATGLVTAIGLTIAVLTLVAAALALMPDGEDGLAAGTQPPKSAALSENLSNDQPAPPTTNSGGQVGDEAVGADQSTMVVE